MQFTTLSIVSLIGLLDTASAFNARSDSCAPAESTFGGRRPSTLTECTVAGAARPWVTYDCGAAGKVVYNYVKNTVRLASNNRAIDGEFTIHGACFDKGHQVAHMDLRMPTVANMAVDQTYAGLNRICDLSKTRAGLSTGPHLYFTAYVLTPKELGQCSSRPVKPL